MTGGKLVEIIFLFSSVAVYFYLFFYFFKVFCATCCSQKCKLIYMDRKEARVCVTCHSALTTGEHYCSYKLVL